MTSVDQHTSVDHAAAKVASVWAATLFTSWADVAAFLAAIYSLLLIGEWLWKRLGRPFCEARGWLKPLRRRKED